MAACERREFLRAAGTAAGAAALGAWGMSCRAPESRGSGRPARTGFRYAMCNESMKGEPWEAQCRTVADAGYEGIEIAPFSLVTESVEEISSAGRKAMRDAMEAVGIACAGLHWLFAPPPAGLHFTAADARIRARSVAYLDALIDFCGDLGGSVMVFGSPKQRSAVGIPVGEAKKHLVDGLAAVADHARERGVKILVEALDSTQTDVVNTLAEAMEIVRALDHPAIRTMFDFHNTLDETEPFHVLIAKHFANIHHVHVQEMDGRHLGTGDGETRFAKAFQTLKDLGYAGWISLEVFDFSPGGRRIAEESMAVLKRIEGRLA